MSNGFMRRRIRAVALAAVAVWSMAANASAQSGIPKQVGALQNAVDALQQQVGALQGQLSTLANQIANLLAPSWAPLNLAVDCRLGQSVGAALSQAQGRAGAVTITIAGTCTEQIHIQRDDVTLQGASPSDGFQAPSPTTGAVISIAGARTSLRNLTITGGQRGVLLGSGSLLADHIAVSGSGSGIEINAVAGISNSTFDGNQTGVGVGPGGSVMLVSSDVSDNAGMGVGVTGGRIELQGTTVSGNKIEGIQSWLGGTVRLSGVTLQGNTFSGLDLNSNSSAHIDQGTQITGNGGSGVMINSGSVAEVSGATISENNGGILVYGGSMLQLGGGTGVAIQLNTSDGVSVWDTGVVVAAMGVQITRNTGWGVFCAGLPAVAQIGQRGPSALTASTVSGNTLGQISCPGNHVP